LEFSPLTREIQISLEGFDLDGPAFIGNKIFYHGKTP
jgi:hypothetical protein